MKKNSLIIYNSVRYFEPFMTGRGYQVYSLYKNEKNIFRRILKKLCEKLNYSEHLVYDDWKFKLNEIDTIIVFAPIYEKSINYIKSKNPNLRIISWYWNAAYRKGKPNQFVMENTEGWGFDKAHSVNFNFKYNNTFYFKEIKLQKKKIEYDVLFVGRAKYREEDLLELERLFTSLNMKTFFHIVPNKGDKNPNNIKTIPYHDYLDLISRSNIILDRLPPLQIGLTLRAMESIFFEKKLITDNPNIAREPFFHPDNIYILNHPNKYELSEFILKPYHKIDEEIVTKYDFDAWYNRIINGIEF